MISPMDDRARKIIGFKGDGHEVQGGGGDCRHGVALVCADEVVRGVWVGDVAEVEGWGCDCF